jgi:hypothetical protein
VLLCEKFGGISNGRSRAYGISLRNTSLKISISAIGGRLSLHYEAVRGMQKEEHVIFCLQ